MDSENRNSGFWNFVVLIYVIVGTIWLLFY